MFGLPPREPGYGLAIVDGRCYQRGVEVECEEREPVWDLPPPFVPPTPAGGTGGVKCAPGYYQDNSGACVPLLPGGGAVDIICAPGFAPDLATKKCVPLVGPLPSGSDRAACLAYVEKYRRVFGRDPAPLPWCMTQPAPCGTGQIRRPDGTCVTVILPPPIKPPDAPPITPGPVHKWHYRRTRKPPVRIPKPPTPAPAAAAEICPTWGYVPRTIPGVDEYQNFKCTPGQPVVIDPGLQAAGRAEALRRHGLGDLDGFTVGNIEVPTWALVAGAALVAFTFMRKGR